MWTRQRWSVRALVLAGFVLLIVGTLLAIAHRPSPAAPVVLYVENPGFEATGRRVLERIAERVRNVFHDQVEWQFLTALPTQLDVIRLGIDAHKPRAVVFANDDYLPVIDALPSDGAYLVPSDLPPRLIATRYAQLRANRHVAFVSWYADNNDKLIELLQRVCGVRPRRVAAFFEREYVARGAADDFTAAARRAGAESRIVEYADFSEFQSKFEAVARAGDADAVHVPLSSTLFNRGEAAAALVRKSGLPAVYSRRDQIWSGGLIASDGPNGEPIDQLALYTALIVRGADPAKLEIAQPTRYEVAINLRAAKAIGCTVPYELLVEAVEIVDQ